jgi:lauroyl/myristoyl acyltransferase
MEFLLGESTRAADADGLAFKYAQAMLWRSETRWRPGLIANKRIEGLEHLTTARDPDRGMVLNFMHHAHFHAGCLPLSRHGVAAYVVAKPSTLRADAPVAIQQHIKVAGLMGTVIPATSTQALADLIEPGVALVIGSDLPGRTPVTWLGRTVLASSGAARIALMTDTPIVLTSFHRDGGGVFLRVHAPIEPSGFDSADALLQEILRRHEPAVLDWPEAIESPLHRWGMVGADAETFGRYL